MAENLHMELTVQISYDQNKDAKNSSFETLV